MVQGGDITNGKARYSVTPPTNRIQKGVTPLKRQSATGVTIQTIAKAKHLPVNFLKGLGVSDLTYCHQRAIKIPYYAEDGTEFAVHFRLALTGDNRFKWRKGDHILPYGLNRLARIKEAGWVLIVEGESDCWTCWHYGIPALGAPGKSNWPPAWGEYLKGLTVYVWQELDAEDFVLRILKCAPELRFIPAPEGIKDISEAHIQRKDVPVLLEKLKSKAESGKKLKERHDNERLRIAYNEAKAVIEADDPLELVTDAIRKLGYGGDLKPALITYLAVTSRLLGMRTGAMPVHLLIMGAPSSGKSYTVGIILSLLPPEAYHSIDAGSPRVLIYDDSELLHKVLVYSEADSMPAEKDNPAASAIRNLLQDHHLHYAVTVRDPVTGNFTVREIDKPGPTVLVTTSVKFLGAQMMSRVFSLEITDSKEQIVSALETQATLEIKGISPPDNGLKAFQSYLQCKVPWNVIVPFAGELSTAIGKTASASRILRDYQRLLSLIKAVTILRHKQRQVDQQGRLIATLSDYETVRKLVNDMYVDSATGVSNDVRNLVKAVREINAKREVGASVSITKIAEYLHISKMAASRRAHKAIKQDWIINQEQRKGYPADFITGEPMPEVEGLPDLNPVTGVTNGVLRQNSFNNEGCNTVTPITDGNTPPITNGDLPDCSACGRNEWTYTPDGDLLCPCGNSIPSKGE